MQAYITYRETDGTDLKYYILQKAFPHITAVISYLPIENIITPSCPIAGYNLYLNFCGTIQGRLIPSYNNIDKEVQAVVAQMAIWFLEHRILKEEKRYKKWKIN